MAGMVAYAPATQRRRRVGRYLAPLSLAAVVAAIVVLILGFPRGVGHHLPDLRSPHAAVRRLPPYWVVRPGDTYGEISARTGLTIAQLGTFNPNVDPLAIFPGQRLNLWRYPPKPPPRPLGPRFWTVRPGQSFGSIAAKTGINIITLEHLNPQLKPSTVQPGDRVRLRR
jgi:LysM repeat protein